MRLMYKKAVLLSATALALASVSPAFAQSDPPRFAQTLPDQVTWVQTGALLPGGQSAVIYGEPQKAGFYVTRTKLPADFKVLPHTHPDERVYTVISGTFTIGFGEKFDPARLKSFAPGSVFVVPANTSHFHWARSGETVVQISGLAPTAIEYTDHADDPRKK